MVLAIFVACASPAMGQVPCTCDLGCADRADPMAGLVFEDQMHQNWYRLRFWTGKCASGLPFCWPGKGWWDVMALSLPKVTAEARPEACGRMVQLGQRIGHEWARDNDIRRIHSREFRSWSRRLRRAEDPLVVLDEVEAVLAQRLGPA